MSAGKEEGDGDGEEGEGAATATATANVSARILAADLRLFSNAGCTPDLSGPVMERALMHCANAYNVKERLRARGRVAKTNSTSNTAFRGFGAPQGMLAFEAAVEQAASALGVAPEVLRGGSLVRLLFLPFVFFLGGSWSTNLKKNSPFSFLHLLLPSEN